MCIRDRVHIEQGPVLEKNNLPVGVVTAIAGQSRLRVEFHGVAGHAGTVPMNLRHDALAGAAEFVLAAENCGVTATVGKLEVESGASNVIPGNVLLTLDVRDQKDSRRIAAVKALQIKAETIARRRGLNLPVSYTHLDRAPAFLKRLADDVQVGSRRPGADDEWIRQFKSIDSCG